MRVPLFNKKVVKLDKVYFNDELEAFCSKHKLKCAYLRYEESNPLIIFGKEEEVLEMLESYKKAHSD